MSTAWFEKRLSPNDLGETGSHQSGILIPRSPDLLAVFPQLPLSGANPSTSVAMRDLATGARWSARFTFYRKKNEYRLTGMTRFLKGVGVSSGDFIGFARDGDDCLVRIRGADDDAVAVPTSASYQSASGGVLVGTDATDDDIEVRPNIAREVEAWRDTGYTFPAAIADLIDNSITHGDATVIRVHFDLDRTGDGVELYVADNGRGMNRDDLVEAMRYGSPVHAEGHRLGKFGLGMKTASTSFCRMLAVQSIPSDESAPNGTGATWDLDRIVKEDRWVLGRSPLTKTQTRRLHAILEGLGPRGAESGVSGTLVEWKTIDRLMRTSQGAPAKRQKPVLERLQRELRDHLEMVFHRFLDFDDTRAPNVAIYLNDDAIEPWDPFLRGTLDPDLDQVLETSESGAAAEFRAFVLPHQSEMDEDTKRRARVLVDRQGIYVYRENRIIEGPGWLGLYSPEPHQNLCRIEISFPAESDAIFGVGLRKSGLQIDPDVLESIKKSIAGPRSSANDRYRKGRSKAAAGGGKSDGSTRTEKAIEKAGASLARPTVRSEDDGSIVLDNNQGEMVVVDSAGKTTGMVRFVKADPNAPKMTVVREESLEDGVLWEPRLTDQSSQLALSTSHPWFVKAYLPNEADASLIQALECLLFVLGDAELNNTDANVRKIFRKFRREVSANLRELIEDLPDPPASS